MLINIVIKFAARKTKEVLAEYSESIFKSTFSPE